jgi:heptosyltransferase-2
MRLLIIRFSSIGDIVLTTPVIRCVKQQIPGVEIHFLTKLSMKEVTEANPYIDHFHYLDQDINALIPALKKQSFDAVIDLIGYNPSILRMLEKTSTSEILR